MAGPFTVESLSPFRVLGVDENDELIDQVSDSADEYTARQTFPQMILENLKVAGVQQAHKEDRINFTALTPWPGSFVAAEGRYIEGEGASAVKRRAAIFIGPEFGTVTRPDLVAAAREAGDAGFDVLIACAFNYEAHATAGGLSEHDRLVLTVPRMGSIVPVMGTKRAPKRREPAAPSSSLADALFPKVQQQVLRVLFGNPSRSFHTNEIIREARSGSGGVQRVLARLESYALITVTRVGRQRHYQANPESPLYEELCLLALKTFALADFLRAAMKPISPKIRAAFVYGSVAKRQDSAASDIDLMVIADDLTYADLFVALEEVTARIGRKISPTIYSPKELADRRKRGNAFVTRVLAQPKLWVIGDDGALAA